MSESAIRLAKGTPEIADRLRWLKQLAITEGCVTLLVEQGNRLVYTEDLDLLPEDRVLVVAAETLEATTARLRIATVASVFGLRKEANGRVVRWALSSVLAVDPPSIGPAADRLKPERPHALARAFVERQDPQLLVRLIEGVLKARQSEIHEVPEFLGIKAICKRYSISRSTFDRELADPKSGLRAFVARHGRCWRVPVAEFDTWFRNRGKQRGRGA